MNGFVLYLIIMNALGFLLMREDKQRAVEKRYRIPESTLLLISALGGTLSACCFVLILCCGYLSTITM